MLCRHRKLRRQGEKRGAKPPGCGDALLTARSSMSIVTASSASTCTVESAFTVTEPLLTAKHSGVKGGLPGGSARGAALGRRPRGAPSSLCQNKTSKPSL